MSKFLLIGLCLLSAPVLYADCQPQRVKLQVLGSGGPELSDQRASSSYLIWLDDKAIVLVDAGSGSSLNYEKSAAKLNDLQVMLFSHLHVDHSADFPAFIKAFYFSGRDHDLPVYGPAGNRVMPATVAFVNGLLGRQGVYRYLNEYLNEKQASRYKIHPHDISLEHKRPQQVYHNDEFKLSAVPVHHGPIPTLAWRVEVAGCALTFSGDTSNRYRTLADLAKKSDLLIAHHAIPEQTTGAGRALHMPPSEIGKIAAQAEVHKVILSHRMNRTLGKEAETLALIRKNYQGPVAFAEDGDIFKPAEIDH
ncbi:MBL fold metallo-hydrolase [Methylomarinum sp. Ch1-1]|uniref:MBL fold metallo-hydrolase n=1 Tax=Methylomarinum roseum TaxID=3067653 RepID=A0AAU7NYX7_9GAMM|nr:MBL fold metallo-hydrolase [Methylomarinum sp. Ch1-1]MDP4521701.1 MBL fold metallo-hydrolase [Methylomarinum sp. Ch1-1]